jgi:hypothetical protein
MKVRAKQTKRYSHPIGGQEWSLKLKFTLKAVISEKEPERRKVVVKALQVLFHNVWNPIRE